MARRSDARSGRRDRLVTLIPVTQGIGSSGYPTEVDGTDTLALWARKDDIGGRERFSNTHETASYDTRWSVPYLPAIDPDHVNVPKVFVLSYLGRRYDIVQASMIGSNQGVELLTLSRNG